jgi:hypothetical protein
LLADHAQQVADAGEYEAPDHERDIAGARHQHAA